MSSQFYLSYTDKSAINRANLLSEKIKIPLIEPSKHQGDIQLWVSPELVFLKLKNIRKPFYVDYLSAPIQYRIHRPQKELLLRACRIKDTNSTTIIDAMAGWGKDSYLLAQAGYQVILLEKSPLVYALLEDGIKRLQEKSKCFMNCYFLDAGKYLKAISESMPDIIYLDPMRPLFKNMPKSKRDMEILRQIAAVNNEDEEFLLNIAVKKALKRVVIKRPAGYQNKASLIPSLTYKGRNTRFDVYFTDL